MSGFQAVLSHAFLNALGWALFHFIWQGAAVAIVLAGLLFVLKWLRRSHSLRACVKRDVIDAYLVCRHHVEDLVVITERLRSIRNPFHRRCCPHRLW